MGNHNWRTGTNPGAGFGDNILSLALSLTYCETVQVSDHSMHQQHLPSRTTETIKWVSTKQKKKKEEEEEEERACKLNLGRNSQKGRCYFPMKHHTPIADPLTLLRSSQSKTFTYNKQRIAFSVGIKIQENNSKIMYISRKSSPKIDWSWLLTLTKPTEIIPTILLFEEIISGGKHCTEYLYCPSLTDKLCSQN